MKKILLSAIVWMLVFGVFAQAPTGYYKSAANLNCSNLKTALKNIISTGVRNQAYGNLWNQYPKTDIKPRTVGTGSADVIWDIYSSKAAIEIDPYQFTPTTNQCGTYNGENDCYNREHSVPLSWFNGSTGIPGAATDYLHIYPTDGFVNGKRSNWPYGEVTTATYTSQNGSKLGKSAIAAITGTVFEPINEFKGDVARSFLYFITRYQDSIPSWASNTDALQAFDATTFPSVKIPYLQLMLRWHELDPVSDKERTRNNGAYSFQGNRNPFIDSPQYVNLIWNATCPGLSTLPVQIVLFSGKFNNNQVQLIWKTANEINVDKYIVEKSDDGNNFFYSGSVSASKQNEYFFTDQLYATQSQSLFYRLKIINADGSYTYSTVLNISTPNRLLYKVSFNTYGKQLMITHNKPTASNALLQVTVSDITGNIVVQKLFKDAGNNSMLPLSNLSTGVYCVSVNDGNDTGIFKVYIP